MTTLSTIDIAIVVGYLIATMAAGMAVRKYVGRVEDFLVAGREMDLWLGVASLAATEFGVVTCVYTAQNGYEKGFSGATPGILAAISMLVVGWTGFGIEPLRQSGVMTIPELFEKRFGSSIRWWSGVVIVLGGLLNMGVFLRTGGEFLALVAGFDPHRIEIVMTALLLMTAVYTIFGGMLSVLATDYLQFIVMSIGLVAVTTLILFNVGWERLAETVQSHYGQGGFNPLVHPEMGASYLLFNLLLNFAVVLTWQTTIARLLSAKDSKVGRRIYLATSFFFVCRFLLPGIWGIAALALETPQWFEGLPAELDAKHSAIAMPLLLKAAVPAGLMGVLLASMLAAEMSTDSSYMLTWGGVIYNDILSPLRKKPFTQREGLLWNRVIVALIGVFLLLYGLWYPLKGDIWTYLGVTGTIYLSSMSVLLIACCYWPRANSWGAAAAILVGAAIPIIFLVLEQLPSTAATMKWIGPYWPGIAAYVGAAVAMVIGSTLKPGSGRRTPPEAPRQE